jgi:hypothetical protein
MADKCIVPDDASALSAKDWLAKVALEPGIAKVIADFPDTLRADATFVNIAARTTWERISSLPFEDISDSDALLTRRAGAYQSDPALI